MMKNLFVDIIIFNLSNHCYDDNKWIRVSQVDEADVI